MTRETPAPEKPKLRNQQSYLCEVMDYTWISPFHRCVKLKDVEIFIQDLLLVEALESGTLSYRYRIT